MLGGGLLCEHPRRHSEANPSMKPSSMKLAMPSMGPIVRSLSSSCATSRYASGNAAARSGYATGKAVPSGEPVVLSGNDADEDKETAEPVEHSGKRVRIGDGKYEFWDCAASLLGRGSYGIVFRGHLRRAASTTAVAVKRMWRVNVRPDELEAMKCVRNANLVALLDVCDDAEADLSYLVMELCDTDLDRHLRLSCPGGRLSHRGDMRVLVCSIANGYHALYRKHIVHRDIKPQNILLLYGPHRRIRCAKITDFGVSRVLPAAADGDSAGGGLCNVAGTLLYMAPEVGANLVTLSEYDHCADVWSIGCLLYQCLTGKVPFDECALCRLFLHCAGGNYDAYDVPSMPADTDAALHQLISQLLQIDRSRRATPRQLYETVCGGKRAATSDESSGETTEGEER